MTFEELKAYCQEKSLELFREDGFASTDRDCYSLFLPNGSRLAILRSPIHVRILASRVEERISLPYETICSMAHQWEIVRSRENCDRPSMIYTAKRNGHLRFIVYNISHLSLLTGVTDSVLRPRRQQMESRPTIQINTEASFVDTFSSNGSGYIYCPYIPLSVSPLPFIRRVPTIALKDSLEEEFFGRGEEQ